MKTYLALFNDSLKGYPEQSAINPNTNYRLIDKNITVLAAPFKSY